MKQLSLVGRLTVCCYLATVSLYAQSTTPNETTLSFLKKFRSDFISSMTNDKPELIHSYYGDDIRLMTESQLTIMGKTNALQYRKAFTERFDVLRYTREDIDVLDLGSRIITCGLFTTTLKLKSAGTEHTLQGKYMNIWKRVDNNLQLVTEAWNYNQRVDIAQQLVFKEVPAVNVSFQPYVPVKSNIAFELAALNHYQEMVITQHDAKLWSLYYADDYMLLRVGSPVVRGRKDIDAHLEAHVKELPVFEKLDIRNDVIDNLGEYVIEYASHTAIVRNGDWSGVVTGKDIRIWRREKDHSLKIIRGIGLYD